MIDTTFVVCADAYVTYILFHYLVKILVYIALYCAVYLPVCVFAGLLPLDLNFLMFLLGHKCKDLAKYSCPTTTTFKKRDKKTSRVQPGALVAHSTAAFNFIVVVAAVFVVFVAAAVF